MKVQAQPYARGARQPSLALTAMLKGRTAGGLNPQDVLRQASKRAKRPARAKRAARPARPPR